jgi:hypothetical protein
MVRPLNCVTNYSQERCFVPVGRIHVEEAIPALATVKQESNSKSKEIHFAKDIRHATIKAEHRFIVLNE